MLPRRIREVALRDLRSEKPRLLIEHNNPERTVAGLRNIFAAGGELFDRGVPVRLAFDQTQQGSVAQVMTADALVLMAHTLCRPYVLKATKNGTVFEANARLSRSFLVVSLLARRVATAAAQRHRDDTVVAG
jgi:hypothetical protein